jgi:D-alanyl-D-alanine dipeptidase
MMSAMRALAFALLLVSSVCAAKKHAHPSSPSGPRPLDGVRQVLVVVTADWSSTSAKLQRYARSSGRGSWHAVGAPVPVVLGKGGLAWGSGLHGAAPSPPVKKEGDTKSPAGAFRISSAFGYSAASGKIKLPYVHVDNGLECVDDAASQRYNTLVDKRTVPEPDWRSSEHMLRADGLYRIGAVVDHNADHPVANAGSCVFLHIASPSGAPTIGCTAMDGERLAEILVWLDPALHPALVQLPFAEAQKRHKAWDLP